MAIVTTLSSCVLRPVPCFSVMEDGKMKVHEEVHFNASCTANATSFSWDFGDGSSAAGLSTKHKYDYSANFIVTLTAIRANKSESSTQVLTIEN